MAAGWCGWREGKKPYDSFRLRRRRTNSSASICAHFKQADEHAKFVPSCKHGERRDGLCDEQRGLVRPAISRRFAVLGAPGSAGGSAFPAAALLDQKYIQCRVFWQDTLIGCATLGRISQLFG